ncbi:hypothetical protein FVEG_06460 [Fusarium verticillioides 7600]|uniref:Uncharacterized protein n=1 Tax=Gibberella moniliformis (strain M3125 / FGSC 7600) TaxID=334819 RepID=W7MMB5_GIBM7|nr:hypothetical protein FVEG_06460 [Fusarium verticillioides 7600]EWG45802.1 hypothetical protein FVEG_06460 [Fusarium verticillioides 7600]
MILSSNPNSVTRKSTALRRSVRRARGGTHTAVPSNDLEGGYASTHSTETIGHSQARASLGKARIDIIAASTGNRTKEAQVWAWLRDADRPWEGFSLSDVCSPQVVQKPAKGLSYKTKRDRGLSSQREQDQSDLGNRSRPVASEGSLFREQGEGPQPKRPFAESLVSSQPDLFDSALICCHQ